MQNIYIRAVIFFTFIVFISACTTSLNVNHLQASRKTQTSKWSFSSLNILPKHKNINADLALLPSLKPQFLEVQIPRIPEIAIVPIPVPEVAPPFDPTDLLRDSIVMYAQRFMGVRYRHAGKSEKGFDCSGFTSFVLAKFGYHISPASRSQATLGEYVPLKEAKKGDLAFFGYKDKRGRITRVSHAALVMSDEGEDIKIIHAARRGITIDDSQSSSWRKYYAPRFLYIKRVIKDDLNDKNIERAANESVARSPRR